MLVEGGLAMKVGDLVKGSKHSGMWGRLGIVLSGVVPDKCGQVWWKVRFGNITRQIPEDSLEVVSEKR